MIICMNCNGQMSNDEAAVFKRMVNRNADRYMCKKCLAKHFGCEEAAIDRKIEQFKRIGCVLFDMNFDE